MVYCILYQSTATRVPPEEVPSPGEPFSVVMSVIVPLSAQSIAAGSEPVKCPDFTQGKWKTTKPKFAVEKS